MFGQVGLSPSFSAVDDLSDAIWVTSDGYTQPTTLAIADARDPEQAMDPEQADALKALPAFYDADGLRTQQLYATSADGTQVPYFLTSRADMPLDGSTPTLLYGYGGFEIVRPRPPAHLFPCALPPPPHCGGGLTCARQGLGLAVAQTCVALCIPTPPTHKKRKEKENSRFLDRHHALSPQPPPHVVRPHAWQSLTPGYSGGIGAAWLEKGYAYVNANIRGGGEYGPRWHQAALKEKRDRAYEDFEGSG